MFVYHGVFLLDIVQMHIETLDAVHRESKRLPPIQKVTNSLFYVPLGRKCSVENQADPLTSHFSPSTHESECLGRYVCVTSLTVAWVMHAGLLACCFEHTLVWHSAVLSFNTKVWFDQGSWYSIITPSKAFMVYFMFWHEFIKDLSIVLHNPLVPIYNLRAV